MVETSSMYEFVGIGELAETTTHLLSLSLHQTVASESRQSTRLGRVEQLVLQQARSYLRLVREGFVLSVRTSQTTQSGEIRYLLDRVLSLSASTAAARPLVDGLLTLLGDDMQALRCSIFLHEPESDALYLAAARGLAPHVRLGHRVAIGQGIVGRVAASREPMLVVDVQEAATHPLLKDEYLTTGSFISFPLVRHDTLIGVVNRTSRVKEDAVIGVVFTAMFALGLVLISRVPSQTDLGHILFGNVLGVSDTDIWQILLLGAAVVYGAYSLYKRLSGPKSRGDTASTEQPELHHV